MAALARCTDAELRSWQGVLGVNSVRAYRQSGHGLQPKASNNVSHNIADQFRSSHSSSSRHLNNGVSEDGMSSPASRMFNTRSDPDQKFKQRLADALRRRLHPNTGLHADQLAGAVGVHGDTLRGWVRGSNAASGPMVSELLRFFYTTGDHTFAVEMFGDAITPLASHAKAQVLKALDEAREALIGGVK